MDQSKINEFFELLFPDQLSASCFTDSIKGIQVTPVYPHEVRKKAERFCINPVHLNKDSEPEKSDSKYATKDRGRRADVNVTEFRNILCEFDKNTIEEQIEWLNKSRLPYSAIVHSGKKSLHVIISLSTPLRARKEYNVLAKKLYSAIINAGIKVDDSTSNPSRLSRYPSAIRSDTGIEQKLLFVGKPVDKGILKTWIKQHAPKPPAKAPKRMLTTKETSAKYVSRTTEKLIKEHIYYTESRHEAFKRAMTQLRKSGHEIEEIEAMLYDAHCKIIPERNDFGSLLKWVERHIIPEENT